MCRIVNSSIKKKKKKKPYLDQSGLEFMSDAQGASD